MTDKNKNFLVSASILSADFSCLSDQIYQLEEAGVDWIHIDVMDGRFVPNITMGPFIVETCRRITNIPLDVHLMIEHPECHIESFANAGADLISIHIENNNNVHRTIQSIHNRGCKAGIVLNPGTPPSLIKTIIHFVDLVLIMTVNPGFSGQAFIPEMLNKIQETKSLLILAESQAQIQVDGGISKITIPAVLNAGADVIVSSSAIFQHPDGILAGMMDLRNAQ